MFGRRNKKKPKSRKITEKELAELSRLEYAEEFRLPEEADKLRRLYEYDCTGGRYIVEKVVGSRGFRYVDVGVFDRFPSYDEIVEEVWDNYGGGTYSVHPEGGRGVFKTWQIPGPSKYRPQGNPAKTQKQEIKGETGRIATDYLRREIGSGSDEGQAMLRALVEKEYGVKVPEPAPEPTYEEELVTQYLEDHPEARRAYAQAKLRKQGVKLPKEQTDLDRTIEWLNQMADAKEALARYEGAGEPEPNHWLEAFEGLLAAKPELLSLWAAIQSARNQREPGHQIPSQQAEGGDADKASQTQVGPATGPVPEALPESAPPSEPPQSAPQLAETDGGSPDSGQMREQPQPRQQEQPSPLSLDPPTMRFLAAAVRRDFIDKADWQDLERGIHGHPDVYVERLRDDAQAHEPGSGAVLGCLLDPDAFLEAINEAVEKLRNQPGRGEEYETAVLVLKHLSEAEGGKRWLEEAHTAAKAVFEEALDGGDVERRSGPDRHEDEAAEDEPPLM
ncbi:MAG: hypothetical protein O2913_14405 [Chloroflexi bacterium]|nr:hypothetical protein [Chloroflexota bacterium]